jgi:hypothetical protein
MPLKGCRRVYAFGGTRLGLVHRVTRYLVSMGGFQLQ